MKKFLILFSVMFLFSCVDNTEVVTFHGYVYDASNSNAPLGGIAVSVDTACDPMDPYANAMSEAGTGYYSFQKEIDCTCEANVWAGAIGYVTKMSETGAVSCDDGRYDFYLQQE